MNLSFIQKFRLIFSLIISNLLNNFLIFITHKRKKKDREPLNKKDKTK